MTWAAKALVVLAWALIAWAAWKAVAEELAERRARSKRTTDRRGDGAEVKLDLLYLPELHATEDAAQKHFENHLLACLACRPGLRTATYCARGQWLDGTRRLAFSISTAPRRRG